MGLTLAACSPRPKDNLVVGMSLDYPPFESVQNGKPCGFEVDIINAISKKIDGKISIRDMDFSGIVAALMYDKIDIAISAISITPERLEKLDLIPYPHKTKIAIVYKKNNGKAVIGNLQNLHIGVQLGSIVETAIRHHMVTAAHGSKNKQYKITSLTRNNVLLQELKLGRIDGLATEAVQARDILSHNPNLTLFYLDIPASQYAIALKKNSPLTPKITLALQAIINSGELAQLETKWFKV